jgi:hypothetical protein
VNNATDRPSVLVPVQRRFVGELPDDVTVEECIALWLALENPAEIVRGEDAEVEP